MAASAAEEGHLRTVDDVRRVDAIGPEHRGDLTDELAGGEVPGDRNAAKGISDRQVGARLIHLPDPEPGIADEHVDLRGRLPSQPLLGDATISGSSSSTTRLDPGLVASNQRGMVNPPPPMWSTSIGPSLVASATAASIRV